MKKRFIFLLLTVIFGFGFSTKVNATTVYVESSTSNSTLYGWLVNENYDKVILNSDVNLSCFSNMYAVNPINGKEKTIDLNGHKLSLGPNTSCGLELNGLSTDGTINIIDSSSEKTGELANQIVVRNCRNDSCHNLTVNIIGGKYTAPTFIKFADDVSGNETYTTKDISLNISNITFTGNLFLKNYSKKLSFGNMYFKPITTMDFTNYEKEIPLSEVIADGYKVVGKDGVISLDTNMKNVVLDGSNLYIAKDIDIIDMQNFSNKNLNYEKEIQNLKLKNPTNDDITIKSITIDNDENFELNGTGTININANQSIISDYTISPKSGLSVGDYKTNVILIDENGNTYVDTISFKVENMKVNKPSLTSSLLFDYDETEHEVTFSNFDNSSMEITGNKATEVGDYTVTISLKDGYCWNDETRDDVVYNWNIRNVNEIENIKIIGNSFLNVNKTSSLKAIINPSDATYKEVTWSVENGTGEATIDQNGLLTAVKVGTVKVKVTAN